MPFEPAAAMLSYFTKAEVSEPTIRRATERAGQAYVEVQTAEVEALEKQLPQAPPGPPVQQVSVDGAYVRLRGKGEWAEVKTLAIGTVTEPVLDPKKGEWEVHARELSYFSRLADHETFGRLATVETHRRGTEKAGVVCGVVDGAEWEQKFLDLHRPDAVRILDFRHAGEYVVKAGRATLGEGRAATSEWIGVQLHELRHGNPGKVLGALSGLKEALAVGGEGESPSEALLVVAGSLEYLEKRKEQIRYAEFAAQGYPIGSGAVESANKLVVETRLKGSGMHWAREHVDPMVALRNIACSDRWEEAWPQISERLRQQQKEWAQKRRGEHRAAEVVAGAATQPAQAAGEPVAEASTEVMAPEMKTMPTEVGSQSTIGPRRPAANHPWRQIPIRRPRRAQACCAPGAET